MSKTGDLLANMLKVHNTHNLLTTFGDAGKTDVCVRFCGATSGRMAKGAESSVWSPSHKTAPNGPWYNHGKRVWYGGRKESLPLAFAWAIERYGIPREEWVPDPTNVGAGSYVPRCVVDRAMAALKKAA